MTIEEIKALKEEAENSINKTLIDFYYKTGVSIVGLDVTIHKHETVFGREHSTISVKIDVRL